MKRIVVFEISLGGGNLRAYPFESAERAEAFVDSRLDPKISWHDDPWNHLFVFVDALKVRGGSSCSHSLATEAEKETE